ARRSTVRRRRSSAGSASRRAASSPALRHAHPPPRREPRGLRGSTNRFLKAVAKPADGGDDVRAQFLADSGDEHLNRVRIAIEILVVNVLDQLGATDHLALVVHEVGEELVLLRGELDRLAALGHFAGARVEANVAGVELARRVPRGAADQGAEAGDQFLRLERLSEIIVGTGVETRDL